MAHDPKHPPFGISALSADYTAREQRRRIVEALAGFGPRPSGPFISLSDIAQIEARRTIAGMLADLTPKPASEPSVSLAGIAARRTIAGMLLAEPKPTVPETFLGAFGSLAPQPFSNPTFKPAVLAKKRSAFFSFHYDDVHRSVIVRNAWRFTDPENNSFRDSSIWEKRKITDPETVKRIIRACVAGTSVICVLVGSETHARRFVRYEIAQAVISERGLLAVHFNGIRHHETRTSHMRGINPLSFMAVGKVLEAGELRYYLFEWTEDAYGRPG